MNAREIDGGDCYLGPFSNTMMWYAVERWCSGQRRQSWFLRETSTWTLRERAEWRWQRLGLRTSPHTTSHNGERGLISDTMWGGEAGEVDEVPDGLYSVFRLSDLTARGRPGPTPQLRPTTWSWCVWVFAPPKDQSSYLLRWIHLLLCMSRRQTRTHTKNIFTEFRRTVSRQNKLAGIITHGFMSLRGELCMIVYMSPLQFNCTFSLYSPTILLEAKFSSYQFPFWIK